MPEANTIKLLNPISLDGDEIVDEVFDQVVTQLSAENAAALRPVARLVVEERFRPQIDQMVRSLQADPRFKRQLYDWAVKRATDAFATDERLGEKLVEISRSIVETALAQAKDDLVKALAEKLRGIFR